MTSNSLISVRLPEDIIEFIDYLVRSGIGKCRSDILRLAVLYKLKSMGYKVSTEELDDVISRLKSFRGSGR
jgi:Arc/MetJ-type ribon-helix-helix transcriptional regulator